MIRNAAARKVHRRYVLAVTASSVILLAALVVLGLQVAAKMGHTVAAAPVPTKPVHHDTPAPTPSTQASAPAAPQTAAPKPQAAETDAPAPAPAADPSVCTTLAASYASIAQSLTASKPDSTPVVSALSGILSAATDLLKSRYDALASTFNASLDQDKASYQADVSAHGCRFLESPFAAIAPAPIL